MIIASLGKAEEVQRKQYVCGICGFALTEAREYTRARVLTL